MADEFCILPYQKLLKGGIPTDKHFCYVSDGKPESGTCRDCLMYRQISEELHQLEEINHLVFHALAREYKMDVDLIGEIVLDFTEMVGDLVESIPRISEN